MKKLNENARVERQRGYVILSLTIILTLFANVLQAQTSFKSVAGSFIKVNGTSNLHDWSMLASNVSCEGSYTLKGDQLADITAMNLSVPVTSLKSKEDLMDTRAYKALKAEQYNKITFKLTDATVVPGQKIIKVTGNLTISGVTNQVTLQSAYTVNGSELTCKGSKSIKMSDFKIKAPSFMMGALKTGDEVTIDFTLKLKN